MAATERKDSIEDTAARWAVRLDAGDLPPEEQDVLDAWLAASPKHHGALIRARAAWMDIGRLAAMAPRASPGDTFAFTAPATDSHLAVRTTRRFLYLAVAASIAILAVLVGLWHVLTPNIERYTTAVGEIRRLVLDDGSEVTLSSATVAHVDFTRRERRIQLTRGEALFEVARDPSRPFIVAARDFTVRAIGTAFAVRVDARQAKVTVTEGVVQVEERARQTGAAHTPQVSRLIANQRAILRRAKPPAIAAMSAATVDRELAWRNGMVDFNGESLAVAVAEINRYSHRPIVVGDATLAARPIVGIFKSTDPEGFAHTAAAALGAEVREDGGSIILLPSR